MSNRAQPAADPESFRTLRELGSRAQRSYAAVREPNELLVTQRFVRVKALGDPAPASSEGATPLDAEAMALLLRDARCLAKNAHPNIGRVIHAEVSPAPRRELTIASELLEGSTLADLLEAARHARTEPHALLLPVPVLVRILLDVLAGLGALHALRDGINLSLGAIHGELCPANIVVGRDGVTRIVNVLRPRPVRVGRESEAVAYAPPEALEESGTHDPRSDVYAVGAILRDGLVGTTGFALARLGEVAKRALSSDPTLRFASPEEMAAELQASAAALVATRADVATRVMALTGARIRTRHTELVPTISGTQRRANRQTIRADDVDVDVDDDDLPGPRGSSPERTIDEALALLRADNLGARSAPRASFTPLLPKMPPARAGSPARASASLPTRAPTVPALPATGTPGDFVIPIDVIETLNESAPRRGGRLRWAVLAAAAALITTGAFVAVRPITFRGNETRPSSAAPTPPAAPAPLPPSPLKVEPTPVSSETRAIAPPPAASASATTSARHAPLPPAKLKRSVYEPEGL